LQLQNSTLQLVFSFLPIKDLCSLREICKSLHQLIYKDIALWKALIIRDFGKLDESTETAGPLIGQNLFYLQYQEKFAIPESNGLAVTLKFSRQPVTDEERAHYMQPRKYTGVQAKHVVGKVRFTLTFFNRRNTPLLVYCESTCGGGGMAQGANFARKYSDVSPRDNYRYVGGFVCGTGATDLFETIEPNGKWEMDVDAFILETKENYWENLNMCVLFSDLFCFLVKDPSAPICFYVNFSYARSENEWGEENSDPNIWEGHISSKYVDIGSANSYL